jgi:hypothetical protein
MPMPKTSTIAALVFAMTRIIGCCLQESGKKCVDSKSQKNPYLTEFGDISDYLEAEDYIRTLWETGNLEGLTLISESDLHLSYLATFHVAETLTTNQLLALCKESQVGSQKWDSAFSSIGERPKEEVMPYIRQVASARIPQVSWKCYDTCLRNNWNDLVDLAEKDLDNEAPVNQVQSFGNETLGMKAREYVDRFRK